MRLFTTRNTPEELEAERRAIEWLRKHPIRGMFPRGRILSSPHTAWVVLRGPRGGQLIEARLDTGWGGSGGGIAPSLAREIGMEVIGNREVNGVGSARMDYGRAEVGHAPFGFLLRWEGEMEVFPLLDKKPYKLLLGYEPMERLKLPPYRN